MELINLTHKVRDLLVITKLVTVFDVKENEAASVASFAYPMWRARESSRFRGRLCESETPL